MQPAGDASPIRVLFVHYPSDLYGASRCLLRLIDSLPAPRFRCTVLLSRDGLFCQKLQQRGIPVILYEGLAIVERRTLRSWRLLTLLPKFVLSAVRIRSLIKAHGISIVHTNTGIILSSALASKLAGVPHVWHIRDWFGEFVTLWKAFSAYILWSSERVLCVSQAIARQFPSSDKVTVLNDGFSLSEFEIDRQLVSSEFRAQYGLGNDFVIGVVGRIKFVRKGQEILVEAADTLRKRGYSFKYILVGSVFPGNEQHLRRLRQLIERLGLERQVLLLGELEDTRPAYAAMDLLVLPSAQPEPFAGVVMEAMAMGVPVIGTNIGGTVEQIVDGETGFLVPPCDPVSLADKIEVLYKDPQLRRRFSQSAIDRIQQRFSLDDMVKRIAAVYEEIAPERG
jgi:glycosyltransferase involved in cell wall biosynthesis